MVKELKQYEKYKTIDIPWLITIPEQWELVRAKNIMVEQKKIVGENSPNYKLLSLTKQGIIYRDLDNAKGKFPKEFDSYKIVEKNDIILCLFDIDETPRTVGISKYSGMITGAYDIFKTLNVNPFYIFYYYLSIDNVKGLKPFYTGLRKVVKMSTFLTLKLPVPTLSEQNRIVRFLDYKIARINKFINAKKREIQLLKEQIASNCYCESGENKIIPSWDSAFDTNWKKIKANHLFVEINIKNRSGEELLAVTQDRGVVFKKECSQNYVSPAGSLSGLKLVHEGDYVISLRSFQGGIEYSFIRGIVSPAYNVFHLKQGFDNDGLRTFFRFLFKTKPFIEFLRSLGGGIRDGKNISFSDFSQFYMPIPSDKQIEKIVNLSKRIDILGKQNIQLFKLLEEFKTTLISDVVTGKIDVRDVKIDDDFVDERLEKMEELDVEEEVADE